MAPNRHCASLRLARAPARLRRASRLCSRRLGAPSPQAGAALRWGRACVSPRGRAAVPNFAALRADFAHSAMRRDPREGPRRICFPGAQKRRWRFCPCVSSQPFAPILPAGKAARPPRSEAPPGAASKMTLGLSRRDSGPHCQRPGKRSAACRRLAAAQAMLMILLLMA